MKTNGPGAPKRARAAERRDSALRMRQAGAHYDAIGKQLGITRQAAHQLVMKALTDLAEKTAENATQLREMELQRLDVAQAAIWSQVIQGDVQAVDRLLKIMARRAAYTGIDAPVKTDIRIEDVDSAIAAELAKLAATRETGDAETLTGDESESEVSGSRAVR